MARHRARHGVQHKMEFYVIAVQMDNASVDRSVDNRTSGGGSMCSQWTPRQGGEAEGAGDASGMGFREGLLPEGRPEPPKRAKHERASRVSEGRDLEGGGGVEEGDSRLPSLTFFYFVCNFK